MSADPKLDAAAVRVRETRDRFFATAHELQHRLDRRVLLDEAVEGVKSRALDAADVAADAAARRPGVAVGAIGAGVLLVFRKPIARLFRRKPKPRDRDDYR